MRHSLLAAKGALVLSALVLANCGGGDAPATPKVVEFSLQYPGQPAPPPGSTHEITYNERGGNSFWLTAPGYNSLVNLQLDGSARYFTLTSPNSAAGTAPHGIEFNPAGQMFVSLEGTSEIARVNTVTGQVEVAYPLGTTPNPSGTSPATVPVDPHGLGIDADGSTVWFTGKTANTIGKVVFTPPVAPATEPTATVTNYPLPASGPIGKPIYIRSGPDRNMWFTELEGNRIGRITRDGVITQFAIPTPNSRPIAIVPDPEGRGMWFTEEAGNKVGFIGFNLTIVEFPVPKSQSNSILGGLAFDSAGNLWIQQYVDQANGNPDGTDFIVKLAKSALYQSPDKLTASNFTFVPVPTQKTKLHRIVEGPDGNMWFTELNQNKAGKVVIR